MYNSVIITKEEKHFQPPIKYIEQLIGSAAHFAWGPDTNCDDIAGGGPYGTQGQCLSTSFGINQIFGIPVQVCNIPNGIHFRNFAKIHQIMFPIDTTTEQFDKNTMFSRWRFVSKFKLNQQTQEKVNITSSRMMALIRQFSRFDLDTLKLIAKPNSLFYQEFQTRK